ncbi:MAG: DUF885 domain-containing protein [Firmicutes bacterium]|nr:DUF885 domain-containing protein [Bacillota bacterium]
MTRNRRFLAGLPADAALAAAARTVLETVWIRHPEEALALGIHDGDPVWPSVDAAGVSRDLRTLRGLRRRLEAFPPTADVRTLRRRLETEIDDLEAQRPFARDPGFYNALIAGTLLAEVRRPLPDPAVRAGRLAAWLEGVPGLLGDARRALEDPPALLVDLARRQFADTLPWLTGELPTAWTAAPAPHRRRAEAAAAAAAEAYRAFLSFLEADLGPRARGPLAWGAGRLARRLAVTEDLAEPLEQLAARGWAELARLEAERERAVAQLVPDGDLDAARARLAAERPSPAGLPAAAAAAVERLQTFCRERRLLTLPPDPPPVVVESPGFLRAVTMASLDPPGPFEEGDPTAYFQVTLPDPGWDAGSTAAYLSGFSPWSLAVIAAHEAYPGHFVQLARLRRAGGSIRQAVWSWAFVEGWAHYTEELVREQGLGGSDPRLDLAWVLEALERVGRLLAAVHLHTGAWSPAETEAFFRQHCGLTAPAARRETWRGAQDPLYLVYTWGKLEILRLREQARQRQGAAFSLAAFHDTVLGTGAPSLPVLAALLESGGTAPGTDGEA